MLSIPCFQALYSDATQQPKIVSKRGMRNTHFTIEITTEKINDGAYLFLVFRLFVCALGKTDAYQSRVETLKAAKKTRRPRKAAVKVDFEKMSLKELEALEKQIAKAIAVKRDAERRVVKQKVAEMAEQHGFSVNELFGSVKPAKSGAKSKSVGVPKYANPDDRSDTWTGRGRKPNWVLERLKRGEDLESFAI